MIQTLPAHQGGQQVDYSHAIEVIPPCDQPKLGSSRTHAPAGHETSVNLSGHGTSWRDRPAARHRAGVNESAFVEHDDRWILGLRGLGVTRITVDYQLSLLLEAGAEVVLEGPCRLSQEPSAGERRDQMLDPDRQDVAAALALFGAHVVSAVAFKRGTLQLAFDNGTELSCQADPAFEAWQVTGPGDWRFVAMPGGELAVWSGAPAAGWTKDF
ncbi:DUF6188 family protein [Streptomyces sp. NPDC059900]|uniref:DUF6188 family protein n=1 Tax=Streptomyces sp. NPDC059900 TaxID=3155816 RepID=UPI003444A983